MIGDPVLIGVAEANTAGTTLVVTVGAEGVAAGERIVIGYCSNNPEADADPTIVDAKLNTYELDDSHPVAQRRLAIYSAACVVPLVNGDTITLTNVSCNTRLMQAWKIPNVLDVDVLLLSNDNTSTNAASGNPGPARTKASAIVVAFVGWSGGVTGDTFAAGAGYTAPEAAGEVNNAAVFRYLAFEYQKFAVVGNEQATGTISASRAYSIVGAAYPENIASTSGGDTAAVADRITDITSL